MAVKLKDQFFTRESIGKFVTAIEKHYPDFNKEKFTKLIYNAAWNQLELKARMRHVTHSLHQCLPADYLSALVILVKVAPETKGFEGMVLPDYVEQYGMSNWEESLNALGHFTRYASSEFAIRPFLDQRPEVVMHYMNAWAQNPNENVRRFASEGCRPRLPWAMLLPKFIANPQPVIELLEKLKNDPSLFVRKSVANNLNDISKDHPDLVMDTAVSWYGYSDHTNWIVKHGLRTLLKNGNQRALALFGVEKTDHFRVEDFKLNETRIKIGAQLKFTLSVNNLSEQPQKVRLEYSIRFVKKGGKPSEKVFQIGNKTMQPGLLKVERKHNFADLTTRKHYPGQHQITIVVNGQPMASKPFELV